jgi:hypothetical protein
VRLIVACDCGAHDTAEPGQAFICAVCGRMWDVPVLDTERAGALARATRAHRARLVVSAAAIVLACGLVAVAGDAGAATFLLPAGAALWLLFLLPSLRRSYRRALEGVGELELRRSSVG